MASKGLKCTFTFLARWAILANYNHNIAETVTIQVEIPWQRGSLLKPITADHYYICRVG
jgi:hypothetical protein